MDEEDSIKMSTETIRLGVSDIGAAMQRFGWSDYIMFMLMLGICLLVGMYYGFCKKSKTAQDYLIGGRTMSVTPIAMSLIASWVSGISLLGIPTEIYVYGIQYTYICGGFFLTTIIMSRVYLPVFQGLKLTSTYEYHERRFDKRVRLFGSVLFTIGLLGWLPLVIYVPALALNQVTGVNVHLITPIVCAICIIYTSMRGRKIFCPEYFYQFRLITDPESHFRIRNKLLAVFNEFNVYIDRKTPSWLVYTRYNYQWMQDLILYLFIKYVLASLGGLKGVVLTDVIQIVIMFGSILLVIIKGTIDIGGFGNVLQRNLESSRLEGPNFDLDPRSRHTIWALVIGGSIYTLQSSGVNQNMIQRYLSLPSLEAGRRALWAFFFGILLMLVSCSYCGLLIYATFHKCDPLTTTLAREKDQLLPLLVMEILGDIPGLPGVFVAGIFSAALSSLSTGLNAMAAVVLEDFYKPFFPKQLSEKQTYLLMKFTVVIMGAICIGMVFVVEKLGAVLQLTMSIGAIANGPSLGLSTMGILLPWVNANGALAGGLASLLFMAWLCIGAQSLISSGDITFPEKSVSTEGCHYQFTPRTMMNMQSAANLTHTDEQYMIYRMSYLWYCLIGTLVALIVGLIVSFITKPLNPKDVDPKLLAPFVRKMIGQRKYPNQPDDGIIYAYGPLPVQNNGHSSEFPDKLKTDRRNVKIEMEARR